MAHARCGGARRAALRAALPLLLALGAVGARAEPAGVTSCGVGADGYSWDALRMQLWQAVEARQLPGQLALELQEARGRASECAPGAATASAVLAASGLLEADESTVSTLVRPFDHGVSLGRTVGAGFPLFGALEWLAAAVGAEPPADAVAAGCGDRSSREFLRLVRHHFEASTDVPAKAALDYLASAGAGRLCRTGRAAATLGLALSLAPQGFRGPEDDVHRLLDEAGALLQEAGAAEDPLHVNRAWPVFRMLHRLGRNLWVAMRPRPLPDGCIVMVYTYPNEEIRTDTAKALQALEEHFFVPWERRYPIVVFTDGRTAESLEAGEWAAYTSAPVVPAVIPTAELKRHMPTHSCTNGMDCSSSAPTQLPSGLHRGSRNGSQFWSSDYLRISRYTAGPLFLHPALDSCSVFLKLDTDFFITARLERDPLEEMLHEGVRLMYWQIHVQGQRQEGYMDASVRFLKERDIKIRNKAFYVRGRFEEKAAELNISVDAVPLAAQAATVIYGCLFGGEVGFFREPLYQGFFEYMDELHGFENAGWSNQFFLGTAAAAFAYPSQIRRLYVSGRHQESKIDLGGGSVTEYLTGSTQTVFR